MRKIKILNLFAGIGGNRVLWGYKHKITSVEYDEDIAKIYHERFPKDKMDIKIEYVNEIPRTAREKTTQLLNLLTGEMSVVGPQAERPEFVDELAKEIPFYQLRHAVKLGMAAWALSSRATPPRQT